jgi:hypothetical protein
MTCYQRHLTFVFDALGLAYERDERARVHSAMIKVLDLHPDAHCPEVWAQLKASYGTTTDEIAPIIPLLSDALGRRNSDTP